MIQHVNIVKYRQIPNKFCLTSRTVLKIMLVIKLIFIVLNILGYSLYILDIPQYKITYIYDIILLILCVCSFSLVHKWKFIPISIITFLIGVAYSSNIISYNETTIYNEYTSPNDKIIVSKSSGYLFSGETNFYFKYGFILKNTNQTIRLDEGYQQVRNSIAKVSWFDEYVVFDYYDENDNLVLTKQVNM